MVNNVMAAGECLTQVDPETTKKLMGSVAKGLEKAEQGLQSEFHNWSTRPYEGVEGSRFKPGHYIRVESTKRDRCRVKR